MSALKINLIGLAGKARSGKDTIAQHLALKHNYKTYAFADPLKQAAAAVFGLPLSTFYQGNREATHSVWGVSPRQMMQILGTDCCRNVIRPDIWLRRADMHMQNLQKEYADADVFEVNLVVTDIRFEDEAQWIREHEGTIIHVKRETTTSVAEHISEQGVKTKPVDYLVYNDSTIEELGNRIDGIVKYIAEDRREGARRIQLSVFMARFIREELARLDKKHVDEHMILDAIKAFNGEL